MKLIPTRIEGCFRIQLQPIGDARGHFTRVIDEGPLREIAPAFRILRVNRSLTKLTGAIRGLHYQREPRAEDKVVQCLGGTIFDVCVDIRPDSPTYHQWVAHELSQQNEEMMLIPKGCAHGFQTLVPDCVVEYFVSDSYSPADEGGIRWDDPRLAIRWPLPCSQTSDKDASWPLLAR